jgi:5-methylthioadenosine/S-adenosylhomocysteine deaminase
MIESGVTTVQHLHGRAPRPFAAVIAAADGILAAYRDIGMRASYSFGLRDQNRLVYSDDQGFVASLPDDLAGPARSFLAAQTFEIDESLEVFENLHRKYTSGDRLAIQLAPVNLHWCSDAAIARTLDMARKHGVPMHMHLLETPFQREYARRRTRTTAVRHLYELGALGPSMTLGHAVWMSEDDIELIAETRTCICHNCSSNLRLRSGIAPLNVFRARRVPVAIGIDEAGINDDRDMLMEMRMVLRMHRVPGIDEAEVPSAAEVFRMATEHGAATTPFAGTIGTIEVGKAADLVLFRWEQIAFPYLSPEVSLVDALVQRARSSGVDTVMVAGEVIFRDGAFTRVDKAELLGRIARELGTPPTENDLRNHELAQRLLVEARRFYSDYLAGEKRYPFYEVNSRT